MPNDPLVRVIPPKSRGGSPPSQPLLRAMLCPCPGPAQPPVSAAFHLPKCRICPFWFPQESPPGLRGQEGIARVVPKPRGLWVWCPGSFGIDVTSSASNSWDREAEHISEPKSAGFFPPRGLAWLREPLNRCRVRNNPAVLRICSLAGSAGTSFLSRGSGGAFWLLLQGSAIIQPASKPSSSASHHLRR